MDQDVFAWILNGRYKSTRTTALRNHGDDYEDDDEVVLQTDGTSYSTDEHLNVDSTRTLLRFNIFIAAIICVNVIVIGLEIDLGDFTANIEDRLGWYAVENVFLLIFTFEMVARMRHHGRYYFRDPWNTLDCIIVTLGIIETWFLAPIGSASNFRMLTSLRVIRLLRLGRLVHLLRSFKELWLIIMGLVDSLKTLGWVCLLLLLVLYVCGIFTTIQIGQDTDTYGEYRISSGGWDHKEYFGTVLRSMYTLFQIVTLENWADGIVRHVVSNEPLMVIFFVLFIMLTSFGLMNLVIGVIVENTLATARTNEDRIRRQQERERSRVLAHLKDIFEMADQDESGSLTVEEFRQAIRNPEVESKMKLIDLPVADAEELFMVLDHDGSGELSVDEFIGGCVRLKGSAKSKDLLAVQVSVESLAKKLDQLEGYLKDSEKKVSGLDHKTKRMLRDALEFFAPDEEPLSPMAGSTHKHYRPPPAVNSFGSPGKSPKRGDSSARVGRAGVQLAIPPYPDSVLTSPPTPYVSVRLGLRALGFSLSIDSAHRPEIEDMSEDNGKVPSRSEMRTAPTTEEDRGLLIDVNARLEDGQAALLEQISMQRAWIEELKATVASQAKQLSKMDVMQRSMKAIDLRNTNELKRCNKRHEVKHRELEMKARESELLRSSLKKLEGMLSEAEKARRWESRNASADRARTALERATRAEKLLNAMAQSLKDRDAVIRRQSMELQRFREDQGRREKTPSPRRGDKEEDTVADVQADSKQGGGLTSVRTEILEKALESRDAIIKSLNERLTYMIDRERAINLERIEEQRERRRCLAELEESRAELGKAREEIERLRKKLPTDPGASEAVTRFVQCLAARRTKRLEDLRSKARSPWIFPSNIAMKAVENSVATPRGDSYAIRARSTSSNTSGVSFSPVINTKYFSPEDAPSKEASPSSPLERLDFSTCRVLEQLPVDSKLHEGVPNQPRPVPNAVYATVPIQPLANPETVCVSPSAFRLLGVIDGIDYDKLDETFAQYVSGSRRIPGSPEPAAHAYCGHQFGYFSGQLGDGAAMLLGEVNGIEIQLKGSGKTPFSRTADGRKVLRSTIREFLCSEHMHALGIPTTRAAAVSVSFEDKVLRDINYDGNAQFEPTAVVVRLAETFIRFGSFEIFKPIDSITGRSGPSAGDIKLLRRLVDFVIENYYEAECAGVDGGEERKYERFLESVVERTAKLVAQWQCVGFCHGVLNTDNMSIIGDTIDYGPFGFLEAFQRDYVCNTSDTGGRYTYEAQPKICLWNCTKLAEALAPILDSEKLVEILRNSYGKAFMKEYKRLMRMKLGLAEEREGDGDLVERLLDVMENTAADFTNTFRALSLVEVDGDEAEYEAALERIIDSCLTPEELADRLRVPVRPEILAQLKMVNPQTLPLYGIDEATLRRWEADFDKKRRYETMDGGAKQKSDREAWYAWLKSYAERLTAESGRRPDEERKRLMNQANPKVVLRNHLAQRVIDAAEDGNFEPVRQLLDVLIDPFKEEVPAEFTKRAPPGVKTIAVS
ncbi:hypothetical protein FOZ61_009971 [Perkinsus olseni]|uniref:Selenoprotein O n=1 Tax=Perkinsus olseni TaxID=32597 RepID=A0A7J6M411_PEROL|nr:hypothetical protein FOZ61_009971 [Perkinsus olseni]